MDTANWHNSADQKHQIAYEKVCDYTNSNNNRLQQIANQRQRDEISYHLNIIFHWSW